MAGSGSGPPDTEDLLRLVRVTLATTDRIAEVVDIVGSQAATAADLAAMGLAVEQALQATNDRLAALEHTLLNSEPPAAKPAQEAMKRLHLTLRRPAKRPGQAPAEPTGAPSP